ncbi:hypothetical protein HC02_05400 [Vibrio parahaemolyticus]|nr:hypothetical protein HC02_05400 [Vibrio parahaemolyticus]
MPQSPFKPRKYKSAEIIGLSTGTGASEESDPHPARPIQDATASAIKLGFMFILRLLFWRQSKEPPFEGKIGSQERAIDNIYTSDPNSDVDL